MKNAGKCPQCRSDIMLPDELHDAAIKSPNISFFCAYGHSLSFPKMETEESKLRRDRDRLAQRIAEKDDEINRQKNMREIERRSTIAYKGVATKLKKRAVAGVCPCCNRSFSALSRHIATQHPEFKSADIIPLAGAK